MLGLRYHVASLAAVFVALAVGILLGVAISGKVSDAERSFERERIRDLEAELDAANERAEAALQEGRASGELVERAYRPLIDRRLEGREIALVFLGPSDGTIRAEVEQTLADAGADPPVRVLALNVPVDGDDLRGLLEGDEELASYAGDGDDFSDLGRELGRELAEGGETPFWIALQGQLAEERSGSASLPADGVVFASTWETPEEGDGGEESAESEATASLLDGLVGGADAAGVPVVGVARTVDSTRAIELYRGQGISSVDDVDSAAGRLALALLLAGADPGHYGVGEGATDGAVPPIEPLGVDGE